MLEKMKKKKDGPERKYSRSRDKINNRKKRKNNDGLDGDQTSQELSFTDDDLLNSGQLEEEYEDDPALQGYNTRKPASRYGPTWKQTMSSIGDSKLFLSEEDEP